MTERQTMGATKKLHPYEGAPYVTREHSPDELGLVGSVRSAQLKLLSPVR
jgi:hypothetical protein